MKETWKGVRGYEELYEVSSYGRVRSLPRVCRKLEGREIKDYLYGGKILTPFRDKKGYVSVRLYRNAKPHDTKVHRLVAEAFIQNPDNLPIINHKDEIKANNRADNLEWCTNTYNRNYGSSANRHKKRVAQYDKDGRFIAVFPSMTEAAREIGVASANISASARGKNKTSGGYIWRLCS